MMEYIFTVLIEDYAHFVHVYIARFYVHNSRNRLNVTKYPWAHLGVEAEFSYYMAYLRP